MESNMSKYRSVFVTIFLILAACLPASAQGRSPLLDKIVASVRKANPKWHFIPGVCTCTRLVPSQTSYAFGGWHPGKLTSRRRVSIYISYVPTTADAADGMAEIGRRDVVSGWQRQRYTFADEAYLWTAENGYAYLYFRKGAIVVELSGALDDVKFFAPHAYRQMAPDNKSLDASGTSGFVIDNLSVTRLTAAASTRTFGVLLL
jgi:hypothetical protein